MLLAWWESEGRAAQPLAYGTLGCDQARHRQASACLLTQHCQAVAGRAAAASSPPPAQAPPCLAVALGLRGVMGCARWRQAQGRRVVVFVVGGITRSEMRAAHKLSAKLGRPVLLGGTALDSPGTFLKRLGVRGHPPARSTLARQAGV